MAANTIGLEGILHKKEGRAAGAITPGHLIKKDSNGELVVHATEGGFAQRYFAEENALMGGIKSTAYADNDNVSYLIAVPGDVVNALLTPGVAYAIGDTLISKGDGTLKKSSAITTSTLFQQMIGMVQEALDLSAGGAVATHCPVRIL